MVQLYVNHLINKRRDCILFDNRENDKQLNQNLMVIRFRRKGNIKLLEGQLVVKILLVNQQTEEFQTQINVLQ